jgi:3-hydroxyisobutyrate dehydrogenase
MTTVGWIGLGVMGAPMAGHLLAAGHELTVATRTPEKAEPLVARGATLVSTAAEVARAGEVVFTMLGLPDDVRSVMFGPEGVIDAAAPGSVLVDCTTSEPALAVEIAEAASERGIGAVDAPVSGGDVGAREARLSIMVGGAEEHVDRVRPLLDVMAATVVHQGPAGAGQHTKAVNQIAIASTMIGVSEALLYAQAAGLDPETVLASISSGAAGSWSLSNLAPRMIDGDFAPGFYVEHFVKDLGIALHEAEQLDLQLPGLSLAAELYRRLLADGGGRSGTQALITTLAELNRRPWPA